MGTLNKNILATDPEWGYVEHVRDACPLEGHNHYKFMTVRMLAGDRISKHKHAYHTVLYYPEHAGPVIVTPTPGTLLYLPPGTLHEVPVTKRERLSIAMLISDANQ